MRRLDEKGSVIVFLTLGIALLGAFIGLSVDLGKSYLQRARLSRLVDGAALAAAKVLKGQAGYEAAATQAACDAMVMNGAKVKMDGTGKCSSIAGPKFSVNLAFVDRDVPGGPPMKFVQVTGIEDMPTHFMGLLSLMAPGDFSKLKVAAAAEAGPERPVDLMLVLDRSGSMKDKDLSGKDKITALRVAVNEFLDNNFSADDRIGMVSFASRGCGNGAGQDATIVGDCVPDVPMDFANTSHLKSLQARVNGLCGGGVSCDGGTNTMEAVRTARAPLAAAFKDPKRSVTRKVVLLITDGQPTFMRRDSAEECEENPRKKELLPGETKGSFTGSAGCKMGVPSGGYDFVFRQPLSSGGNASLSKLPPSGGNTAIYKDLIRCTRSLSGCVTNGAMYEANEIRNCGYGNDSCNSAGTHDVVFFAIAIGQVDNSKPQSSLDDNAKCLLARMANANDILNVGDGSAETIVDVCGSKAPSIDGDTHDDLRESWPCVSGPCIDDKQQKGKVYTVDLKGDVQQQLQIIFNEIAAILKLRLSV